ncbi:FliM/FliN family flagellar motor switch protein [Acinetobacter dispersus]|uniref:Flagellar motor switch protein FliN n=1 Tax=Acinetobacter dispersus TaxID=70348 RepID=N9MEH0_9GAMM|nr:FliM/FliN family flagellar motor switch protein [Acinetobacter dispersus]ENW91575.1 flagellar motor switch protein FliN [Acinetobacter dispersus]
MTTQINEINLPSLREAIDSNAPNLIDKLAVVEQVDVELIVEVGSAKLTIGELLSLKEGCLVKLDQSIDEPLKLYLKDHLVGYGKLVAVDDVLGFQITQLNEHSA